MRDTVLWQSANIRKQTHWRHSNRLALTYHTLENNVRFTDLVLKETVDNWFYFLQFWKNKPRASNLLYLLHPSIWGHETSDQRKSCDTGGRTCLVFLRESFFVWMASCLDQHLWSLQFMSQYSTIPKSYSRPAVHVILVVTGVTVSLLVRNCCSIFSLSVFLMSGLNGE